MTTAAALLPTRKDEDFRYADLAALERVWPVAVESIALGEGEHRALSIVNMGVRELAIVLAPGASLDLHVLNAGQGYGRIAVRAKLNAGARFNFGAAQLAGAGQTLEVVTHISHLAPDAISQQTVRSVAGGGSTVNYLGKVHVAKGADGTDGSQSVRAMLLDRRSAANAKPELEIHADDVKCAHGCAVGELDANALFYMAQRGLPPEAAKKLMLQAFVAEAFTGAADEETLLAGALAALEAML
ncbi:MAG: SufD family Fe-S cluster assembly protein [Novosphingobium sp.]